ncbi:MAG: hypothetical protein HND27_05175 [Bacteroidetes bacterium]|nr:hypothetical protein [Bacteroidota bacterium]
MRKSLKIGNNLSTFGSTQPNPNNLNANQYRYGFGGMEQDKQSSSYTTYFRQYDPRIARWKSTDPVTQPWQSPYTAFDNNPIFYTDPSGAIAVPNKRRGIGAGGSIGGIGGALAGSAQTVLSLAIRSGMQASMVGTYMQSAFLPTSSATNSGRELGVGNNENTLKDNNSNIGNTMVGNSKGIENTLYASSTDIILSNSSQLSKTNNSPVTLNSSELLQGLHMGKLRVQLVNFTTGVTTVPFNLTFAPNGVTGIPVMTKISGGNWSINARANLNVDVSDILKEKASPDPDKVYFIYNQLELDGKTITQQYGTFSRPQSPTFNFTTTTITP